MLEVEIWIKHNLQMDGLTYGINDDDLAVEVVVVVGGPDGFMFRTGGDFDCRRELRVNAL